LTGNKQGEKALLLYSTALRSTSLSGSGPLFGCVKQTVSFSKRKNASLTFRSRRRRLLC